MQKVIIYADGACKDNPGLGAYGAILECNGERKEIKGAIPDTTNNRMELKAVIEALKLIKQQCTIEVYTDSQYVQKGMTEWIGNWKQKKWKNVKNIELWQELDSLASKYSINWYWVKGHNGDTLNERADELANIAIREYLANS
jgi:ribonuclease HI